MTEQEQNDFVAAKLGIIFLCLHCPSRVHSIDDKSGIVIGWIHTDSGNVKCDSPFGLNTTYAFPASMREIEARFNPKPNENKRIYAARPEWHNFDWNY